MRSFESINSGRSLKTLKKIYDEMMAADSLFCWKTKTCLKCRVGWSTPGLTKMAYRGTIHSLVTVSRSMVVDPLMWEWAGRWSWGTKNPEMTRNALDRIFQDIFKVGLYRKESDKPWERFKKAKRE